MLHLHRCHVSETKFNKNDMQLIDEKDPELWKIATKRAAFRQHLYTYIIINGFFWAIWFFGNNAHENDGWPWPVWPMLGWGIGLAFSYFDAYHGDKSTLTEHEYERLKREKEGK